jgi:hypothetical protein
MRSSVLDGALDRAWLEAAGAKLPVVSLAALRLALFAVK